MQKKMSLPNGDTATSTFMYLCTIMQMFAGVAFQLIHLVGSLASFMQTVSSAFLAQYPSKLYTLWQDGNSANVLAFDRIPVRLG
jgi:membrane-bound inhibitor of C-type lysozyme